MTLGSFLQQAIDWIYEFWPVRIIREWEQGVRLRNGNVTSLLTSTNGWRGSGMHGFWPLIGEVISEDVNTRVIETPWQTVDGMSWSLAARYKVRDLGKLYVEIHDHEETIQNVIASAASKAAGSDNFIEDVKRIAGKRLSKWGVTLLEVTIYNRVEAPALRLLTE